MTSQELVFLPLATRTLGRLHPAIRYFPSRRSSSAGALRISSSRS
jgi:hypothetical protein